MGIHVILDIDPDGIEASAWNAIYEQSLALLEAWQPRLLGYGTRLVEGVRVPLYARTLRSGVGAPDKACWSVSGDRESLRTAECASLYRDLSHYRPRRAKRSQTSDLLLSAARRDDGTCEGVRVFGDKTQGHPYHLAVLAAAMLVEERFPLHAMAWGNIDRGQAEKARCLAAPILGRELPLPVRTDPPQLLERLRQAFGPDELGDAFLRVHLGGAWPGSVEPVLRELPGASGARPWKRLLAGHAKASEAGVVLLLVDWLNAGRDLREACRFACLDPQGPRFEPEAFVRSLARTFVAIPRSVREPLDVLSKPEGSPYTIDAALGSALLDMDTGGRHLRVGREKAALETDLAEVFGERGGPLATRLFEHSTALEEELREMGDALSHLLPKLAEQGTDDTESLAALEAPERMGPTQRLSVQAVAWYVSEGVSSMEREPPEFAKALRDPRLARRIVAHALSERGPVLTEEAWDAFLAETDPDALAWWCTLAASPLTELHLSQVRRALLENARLRAASRDPKQRSEWANLLEKARKRRPE
ncbi:MAG: hypothetical protein QM765_27405 [Myxococcales bacterium]